MATRKLQGGAMIGPGGNKPPFNFGFLKSGPHNTTGVMNSNNNSPKTRRRKKKHSGASAKKGFSAKKYRNKNVVFRHKSRVNANKRTLKNIQAAWNNNQLVGNMERIAIKKKEKKKGISFKN